MAQLLIFKGNTASSESVNSGLCSYSIDDVVVVAEDDHVWGSAEVLPPFSIEQVAGVKLDFEYLLIPIFDKNGELYRRRAYCWTDGQPVLK